MSRHARSKDLINSKLRASEAYYRRRVEHDAVFRCTHGIACGGGCSLSVHVKNGLITWESPEPLPDSPTERGCEPRGCQRGLSASNYVYGPARIKHPYVRGSLLDLWSEAQKKHDDPVEAWASLVGDDAIRRRWQKARGRGGFRRVSWDAAIEIIAASTVFTIRQYGPDRIAGYSSSPAPSMVGYAAGSRFLQLLGGACLSHSDWESTAAPALSETWGEQNECHEAADWRHAKLLVIMADNLSASRPADFAVVNEARQSGSRVWYLGPEFNTTAKHSDEWVQLDREGLAAWWLAVNHVLLKDLQSAAATAESSDYLTRFTDAPFLVTLNQDDNQPYKPGQLLRASDLEGYVQQENPAWKFSVWDSNSSRPKVPKGSIGFRWDERPGLWDLALEDALDKTEIRPCLSFFEDHDEIVPLQLDSLEPGETAIRKIPARRIITSDGQETRVVTVFDLLMSQYGVLRVPDGVRIENDEAVEPFSPAWAEKYTHMKPETIVRFAREWAQTARLSGGRCLVIGGKESSQEFHSNLTYRAAIHALMLCGCVGVNGGGLSHCAGQRLVSPVDSWSCVAFAQDWVSAGRFQNATSWFHTHSGQHDGKRYGYEQDTAAFADLHIEAVKQGWIGFYPQFGENPFSLASKLDLAASRVEGAHTAITDALNANKITWAVENTGAPENWPRIFFLWRSNALYSNASGHEYLLGSLLGTESNAEPPKLETSGQTRPPQGTSPGKLDLLVDLSFRMDTSALYSDIVLPATTWYEKEDINSTEAHSFIQPISRVIDPCWEAKSEWQAFKLIAEKVAVLSAKHLPEKMTDVVTTPLTCETADEISLDPSSPSSGPGDEGCRVKVTLIHRDYKHLAHQFVSLGPLASEKGLRARGFSLAIDDLYTKINSTGPSVSWSAGTFPSLSEDKQVCDLILLLSSATNGNLAKKLWEKLENRVGRPLVNLSEELHNAGFSYEDLLAAPQRTVKSPLGSDAVSKAGTYTPFADNIELGIPWRTLTGRQHFFIDHPVYLSEGEHLPAFRPDPRLGDRAAVDAEMDEAGIMLRFFPLQSRWCFDSMFGDSTMMRSLSRDLGYLWLSVSDAEDLDLTDDSWAEVSNRHGAVVARVTVSTRVNRGTCRCYIPDRTLAVPKSPSRGYRRAGGHSSLDRIRAKPSLLAGGYGQICYGFDYSGPVNSKGGQFVVVRKIDEPTW